MIHGNDSHKSFAEHFDRKGNYFGTVEDTEALDYKTKEGGMKK